MFGPEQTVIWGDLPFPNNPYPAIDFATFGLGGGSHTTYFYVPAAEVNKNVHMVQKDMSQIIKGGRSYDRIIPQTSHERQAENMKGGGADLIRAAFERPIKVLNPLLIAFFSVIDGFYALYICVGVVCGAGVPTKGARASGNREYEAEA